MSFESGRLAVALAGFATFLNLYPPQSVLPLRAQEFHTGLYVTCYYVGKSIGGVLPGLVWIAWGWPGCVATVTIVLALMALTVWRSGATAAHPLGAAPLKQPGPDYGMDEGLRSVAPGKQQPAPTQPRR